MDTALCGRSGPFLDMETSVPFSGGGGLFRRAPVAVRQVTARRAGHRDAGADRSSRSPASTSHKEIKHDHKEIRHDHKEIRHDGVVDASLRMVGSAYEATDSPESSGPPR